MTEYRSVTVSHGSGGYGGPLTITPTEAKHKLVYIVGGGVRPPVVDRIAELSGAEPVNGFSTSIPDEEMMAVIIDCGGTLRCGIYPRKGIPTINVMPTGKSGPLAQYINESIYVSAVDVDQVRLADSPTSSATVTSPAIAAAAAPRSKAGTAGTVQGEWSTDKKISEVVAEKKNKTVMDKIGLGAGKVISVFYQAARGRLR